MTQLLSRPPRSALTELVAANTRELLRDGKTMFFVLLFPLFFLALFWFIGHTTDAEAATPVVSMVQDQPQLTEQLHELGIQVVPDTAQANTVISVHEEAATVTLASQDQPAWHAVVQALRDTGMARTDIQVLTDQGAPVLDPLRTSLASILMVSFLSLAFLGTAVPLVSLRGAGTLRLLGTTPVKRSTFVLAQSPARFGLGLMQLSIIVAVTGYLGYLDLASLPRLLGTALLGLVMLFALGYLIGSRASNPEATTMIVSLLLPAALMLSGAVIPLQVFPEQLVQIMQWLPTTLLANALSADLVGSNPELGVGISWAVMATVTGVAALGAVKIFRWDQGATR